MEFSHLFELEARDWCIHFEVEIFMVLFDRRTLFDFPSFGIEIPTFDSRKTNTLSALSKDSELGRKRSDWLIESFEDIYTLDDLLRVNTREYASGFFDLRAEERLISGFELVNPDGLHNRWKPENACRPLGELIPHLLKMVAGTYGASRIALESGFCHYLGGGAHHGHRDFGHGFCPLNDTALAIRKLQAERAVHGVWVIDLDAHKGDGTAAIFADRKEVTTLSIHMAQGWPLDGSLPKNHPSWIPSDIDIPIESGEEHWYLERLEKAYKKLGTGSKPDLAIVLAGADPWENDALASTKLLNLSFEEMKQRDRLTYLFLEDARVPSLWLTAGGYGEDSWQVHATFLEWALARRLGR